MGQSLASILIHFAWSTKNREARIIDDVREELHAYTVGVLKGIGSPSLQVNSMPDHIHILCSLSRTLSVADFVQEVKTSTSTWMKKQCSKTRGFSWQNGYGAFSVSQSRAAIVSRYIRDQRNHHKSRTFQDEFRGLLTKHGVAFDERYVWD